VIETADPDVLIATSDYGETVPAVVGRGEIMGTQFHPEKSSRVGIGMLENFGAIVRERSGAHE
jgi:glutamine amidotransferase